ncbi:MAG TPA: hypothetical protein VHN20_00390 [Beijerinckiaceae bacterium]|nr:hypothetical protein [Beijerinckiaceae bacterium]
MDQARRPVLRDPGNDPARRPKAPGAKTGLEGLDNVLRLAFASKNEEAELFGDRNGPSERDWVKTLYLVDQAADALTAAEDRIRELEARNEEIVQRAGEELKAAHTAIQAAETRALRAETRAREAEERSRTDREWLMRIHDAMEQLAVPRGLGGDPAA